MEIHQLKFLCFHCITVQKMRKIIPKEERQGERLLEMNVHNEQRIVEIWLTRKEKNDSELREGLKSLYQDYKNKKYTVAVYCSGEQDLYRQTSDLLCYNRRRIAELEQQEEQEEDACQEIGLSL